MQVALQQQDYVLFSEELKKYYPQIYNELSEILSHHNVRHGVLKGTADYWCRDYMPIQVDYDKFVQFRYHPDYLKGYRDYETPTEVSLELAKKLTSASIETSPIIADGGNFTFASIKRGRGYTPVVVMTEKVFLKTPKWQEKILFISWKSCFQSISYCFFRGIEVMHADIQTEFYMP